MVINSGARFWKKNIYGLAFGWLDFRERGLTGVTDLASWLCCCLLSFCGVSIICARIIRPHQWESLPHMMWSHLIIICNTRRDFVSEPKLCVTRSCRIACHGYTNWCDQKVQDGLSRMYKLVWPESAGWLVTDIQTGVTRRCRMAKSWIYKLLWHGSLGWSLPCMEEWTSSFPPKERFLSQLTLKSKQCGSFVC